MSPLKALLTATLLALGFMTTSPAIARGDYGCGSYGTTVADIIIDTEGLDTLEAALAANDLVELFDGCKRFTVFAPTNEAFADLGLDENSDFSGLGPTLGYHATKGRLSLRRVVGADALKMVLSGSTTTGVSSNGAVIKGTSNNVASLIVAEVLRAVNGNVYVIDRVLLP